jgi:MFS family permease
MTMARRVLIWGLLAAAILVPLAAATMSEQLAWRGPVYSAAGFAGIVALGLVLIQPLLIAGYLPDLTGYRGRRVHHWVGGALVATVIVHVAGLWITSPPDMIDALTYTSPTPFSPFGVTAMWAIFAVAVIALFRRHLRLRTWRLIHLALALVIVAGAVAHTLLIEGTMETVSKIALCALVAIIGAKVLIDLWLRTRRLPRDRAVQS